MAPRAKRSAPTDTPTDEEATPYVSSKRSQPAVLVPRPSKPGPYANSYVRELEQMVRDLGYHKARITGHYGNELRNSVSLLQQDLITSGHYDGVPHGTFDAATRQALLDSDIPTTVAE